MYHIIGLGVVAAVLLAGGAWWSQSLTAKDPSVVSTDGIHWHPELEIYARGERVAIPENVGLLGAHSPIHTHDDLPIIHMEFATAVMREDTELGNFFRVWGKDFMEFGSEVTMTVNGEVNTEFASYQVHDGDRIELRYE